MTRWMPRMTQRMKPTTPGMETMCDIGAGQVIVKRPPEGPGAELAFAAVERAGVGYGAHVIESLRSTLSVPAVALWHSDRPRHDDSGRWAETPPFLLELVDVPPGAEQAFIEDLH